MVGDASVSFPCSCVGMHTTGFALNVRSPGLWLDAGRRL